MYIFVLLTAAALPGQINPSDDVTPAVQRLAAFRAARQMEAAGRAPEALAELAPFSQGDDPLAVAIQFHAARVRLLIGERAHPALASFLLRPAEEVRWGITRRDEAETLWLLIERLRPTDPEAAADIHRRAALEYPRWVPAPDDLDRAQRRQLAESLIRDMDYEGGLGVLEQLLDGADARETRELQRAIGHLIGDKMRDDYARVRDIYRELAERPDATRDDLFYLAYATGKVDPKASIDVYREIARRFAGYDDADKARFFIAWTELDLERLEEAMAAFDTFLRERPTSGWRFAVRWYRGLTAFRLGLYEQALDEFEFTARYTSHYAKGRYWSARAHELLGHTDRAREILYSLAERRPFSYYGILARALLPEGERPPVFDVDHSSPQGGLSDDEAHAALERLSAHGRALVTEAFAAVQLGWPELADATLAYLERGELRDREYLRHWLQRHLGVDHRAVRSRVARRCRATLDEDPKQPDVHACWSQLFPTPHEQVITEVRGELPASVFWSIMRQESYYQPTARSHADALGLMQLIPQVGEPAATALGHTFAPYELYQPETNLRLFALAAHERAERFAGHVPLILMSYNATPEKAQYWLRDNSDLPFDLFVEEIPWSETREYVKHISVNLARYETLLGAEDDLLVRAHLPHPKSVVAEVWGDALERTTELASAK